MLVLQKIESSGLDGGGTLPGLCLNICTPEQNAFLYPSIKKWVDYIFCLARLRLAGHSRRIFGSVFVRASVRPDLACPERYKNDNFPCRFIHICYCFVQLQ